MVLTGPRLESRRQVFNTFVGNRDNSQTSPDCVVVDVPDTRLMTTKPTLELDPVEYARNLRRLPPPGERRRLRLAAGLSLHQVARSLGLTASACRLWETGERRPGPSVIGPYVELLDGISAIVDEEES